MMFPKKFHLFFLLVLIAVAVTGCGQLSVGIVTSDGAGTEDAGEVVATAEPATPVPAASPEVTPETEVAPEEHAIPALAYVGVDGNLWLLEAGSESPRQLTDDANGFGNERNAVTYDMPRLSFDGLFLAYRQDVGIPSGNEGYEVNSGLYVLNLQSSEVTLILGGYAAGWAWKPGTHVLAFGTAVDTEYFMSRGEPDSKYAEGIRIIDLDTGEVEELVAPERGYTLAGPQWSPDGRFLGFSEVMYMEGSGNFAYFDLTVGAYYSWEAPIGPFSWSPNGGLVAYALQTYTATGEERLYVRERNGGEQAVGPDYEGPAYATAPEFSPDGSRIAYLAFLEGPDVNLAEVTVLDLTTGETQSFGKYEGVWQLAWTPDGSHLVFYGGPWEQPQVLAVSLADGTQTVLAEGSQPALAGR